jgi:hypothetical protein
MALLELGEYPYKAIFEKFGVSASPLTIAQKVTPFLPDTKHFRLITAYTSNVQAGIIVMCDNAGNKIIAEHRLRVIANAEVALAGKELKAHAREARAARPIRL